MCQFSKSWKHEKIILLYKCKRIHLCIRKATGVGWCPEQDLRKSKERNKIKKYSKHVPSFFVQYLLWMYLPWNENCRCFDQWTEVLVGPCYSFYWLLCILGPKCPFYFLYWKRTNQISSFKQRAAVELFPLLLSFSLTLS